MKVLSVFGTRPEVIKMAPVIEALNRHESFEHRVCVTGQHRQMLHQCLSLFKIYPDFDLDIMRATQSLADIVANTMSGLETVFGQFKPDCVLVQGDTTSAMASALAAHYHRVRIGHVEAGLRTRDLYSPWPEEANRRLIGVLTHYHFAPTQTACENLLREGVPPSQIFVTGNTVVEALAWVTERMRTSEELKIACRKALPPELDYNKKLILVTGHRRESFGAGMERVFGAIAALADREDVQVLYPVHLNPNVLVPARKLLSGRDNVFLTDPLDYLVFVYAMMWSYFIITDSGGVQEEAPILGKPLLITRDNTERPEAVLAGTGVLVGTDPDKLIEEGRRLLDDPHAYASMSRKHNRLGDGTASQKIASALLNA